MGHAVDRGGLANIDLLRAMLPGMLQENAQLRARLKALLELNGQLRGQNQAIRGALVHKRGSYERQANAWRAAA
jgi:hypothetical protein